ncbi:MAG: helix-turn-helix domain-containing protein [Pleomorphochaeta sp.]
MDNKQLNYKKALFFIIDKSGLSIDDFAEKAKISPSLIRHTKDDWNPKFETVDKICSVLNISIVSFFAIAEHESGYSNSITLKYSINRKEISQEEVNKTLKNLREKAQLSKAQLAKKSGINKTNICNREHLKINNHILCSTLEKYAKSFGLSMSKFCEKLDEYE